MRHRQQTFARVGDDSSRVARDKTFHAHRPRAALCLASLLAVSLTLITACGGSDSTSASSNSTNSGAATGDLGLKDPGTITFGITNDPPISFVENGEPTGLYVDLTKAMASNMGLKTKYVTIPIANIVPNVQNHVIDSAAFSLVVTPDRTAAVSFTTDVTDEAIAMLYRKGQVVDPNNLSGRTLGALVGSVYTGQGYFPSDVTVKTYPNKAAVYSALSIGAVDGVPTSPGAATTAQTDYKGALEISRTLIRPNVEAMPVAKDRPALLAALNSALKKVMTDGTYATLYKKWNFAGEFGISTRLLAIYPGLKQIPDLLPLP